jgi:sterol 3beta-glucosyltransferase
VICPFVADQPFWGRRMNALGVAPPPVPQRRLSATRLAAALGLALTDATMGAAATALGHRIREEDGVGAAVEQLELLVPGQQMRSSSPGRRNRSVSRRRHDDP